MLNKLFVDDLGDGPTVAGDELREPFATVVYARRAEAGLERDSLRRAALEAVRTAESGSGADTGNEQDVLSWLEAELAEVRTRVEGGSLSMGQERQRDDLLQRSSLA